VTARAPWKIGERLGHAIAVAGHFSKSARSGATRYVDVAHAPMGVETWGQSRGIQPTPASRRRRRSKGTTVQGREERFACAFEFRVAVIDADGRK
jgi:hypothetical protein